MHAIVSHAYITCMLLSRAIDYFCKAGRPAVTGDEFYYLVDDII
jgi:hypothetical protein